MSPVWCFSKVVNGRHMLLLFRLPQIYEELYHTVNNADHDKDLKWWSFNHGVNMGMNWPQFEVPLLSFFCLDSKTRKKVISKNPACVFCGRRTNACDTKKSYFVLFFSTTFLDMITYFDFSYFFCQILTRDWLDKWLHWFGKKKESTVQNVLRDSSVFSLFRCCFLINWWCLAFYDCVYAMTSSSVCDTTTSNNTTLHTKKQNTHATHAGLFWRIPRHWRRERKRQSAATRRRHHSHQSAYRHRRPPRNFHYPIRKTNSIKPPPWTWLGSPHFNIFSWSRNLKKKKRKSNQ